MDTCMNNKNICEINFTKNWFHVKIPKWGGTAAWFKPSQKRHERNACNLFCLSSGAWPNQSLCKVGTGTGSSVASTVSGAS